MTFISMGYAPSPCHELYILSSGHSCAALDAMLHAASTAHNPFLRIACLYGLAVTTNILSDTDINRIVPGFADFYNHCVASGQFYHLGFNFYSFFTPFKNRL